MSRGTTLSSVSLTLIEISLFLSPFSVFFVVFPQLTSSRLYAESFVRPPVSGDQQQRILKAPAIPVEYKDVRVLINEDNLTTYGWISTRLELDPDQLRPYKPAAKMPKSTIGASSVAAEGGVASSPKKSTSSEVPKKKKVASSLKSPAS